MDVLQLWWLMLKQSEAILQLCQTFPHRQVDQSSALQSHVLTRSFLRRETADPTAATKGKRWTSAGSQICQVITKLCIKHWHKHRCAHTNLACSMCCTSTHTHTHTLFSFLSITTFVLAEDRTECLLLWSWPSWSGSCCPNPAGEVWNKDLSALAKTYHKHRSWTSSSVCKTKFILNSLCRT